MITENSRGSIWNMFWWQWKNVLLFVAFATLPVVLHDYFQYSWAKLPTTPLAVFGAALGIFVSFRTNSCYDRWWEGRKLWGRMINTSRHISLQAVHYTKSETAREIVMRHAAYVHTLRVLLRKQSVRDDVHLTRLLNANTRDALATSTNATNWLLDKQLHQLRALHTAGDLDDFRLSDFDESIRHLLDIQGGCERIKKTPLPRAYGFVTERLIQWFAFALPFALVEDLSWVTIPVSAFVGMGFLLISEIGRVLDDPFNMFYNGLPLSSMSLTIERNIREMLGDEELPDGQKEKPVGVLM